MDYSIEGTDGLHLYMGFTNPHAGSYKNFIQVDVSEPLWCFFMNIFGKEQPGGHKSLRGRGGGTATVKNY